MPVITSPPVSVPLGLKEAIEAAGHFVTSAPEGWIVDDAVAVQAIITGYVGSARELTFHKAAKQAALDEALDANFDLKAFIRAGTATGITGAQVGAFLAAILNNYRTLRASITAAATVAAVNAINIAGGWPTNP